MKYFVILLVLVGFAGTVHAEDTFSGHSSIDPPISEITPRQTTTVTVLFQYTSGPYAITYLSPQVEITPQSAKDYVKIDVESIELNRGDIRRIPIMVTVDQDIPHEKIFLSISFSGKHFQTGELFKSSWIESTTLDIAPKDVIGFELGDCTPIEIDYDISGVKESIICKSQSTNSVKAFFDAKNNGTITLDIPKHILYGIGSTDCKLDNNFFVIYNGEEIAADITEKNDSNLVSFDFESGIHEIEIIGTFILPSPSPVQYCGIVENYPKTYLSPLDQIQRDMKPSQIRCNDGLVLLHKYDDSPACVTESTKTKLIERGWTGKSNNDAGLAKLHYPVESTEHIKANNQLAIDFYSKVSSANSNAFFSPVSLSNAFAILYEGTQGNTANELQQTFGFLQNDLERKHGYLSLNKELNKNTDGVVLKLSNALWLGNNFKPLPDYVDTAQKFYGSMVKSIDFTAGNGHQTINQWVSTQTEGKIKQLFDELDPSTVFVITNTIYFDGAWKTQFDPKDTKSREFHVDSETTVTVPMMVMENTNFLYASTDNLQVLEIPYQGNKKSMLILLPETMNGLQFLEDTITLDKISELKENMRERHIVVMIPKFSLEADYNLVNILPEMGVSSIFNADADFGKMTNANGLYVYKAIHKAVIDVDERGTEAAAATGIGGFMGGPPSFIADHPFMFIIQDNETGQILFMGRVIDPTK